jgi:hypothetical protein
LRHVADVRGSDGNFGVDHVLLSARPEGVVLNLHWGGPATAVPVECASGCEKQPGFSSGMPANRQAFTIASNFRGELRDGWHTRVNAVDTLG